MVTLDAPQTNSKCPLLDEPSERRSSRSSSSWCCSSSRAIVSVAHWVVTLSFVHAAISSVSSHDLRYPQVLEETACILFSFQTRGYARPMPLTRRDHASLAKRLCEAERSLLETYGSFGGALPGVQGFRRGIQREHSACR